MTFLFDGRWRGNFGIGRHTTELQARLKPSMVICSSRIRPLSPLDPAYLRYQMRRSGAKVLFTPGYNASVPGPFEQLLIVHDLNYVRNQKLMAPKRLYMDRVVRPAIRRTGTVLTVSAFSRDEIVAWTGLDPSMVVVCGGGLGASFGDGLACTPRGTLTSVLFVGNDKPHKNLLTLLAALRQLPGCSLECVGVAPEQGGASAAAAGVADRVRFLTGLTDTELVERYRACDVLAFPSTYEGFGLPALEAMSQGKPVVYACDAIEEIVAGTGARVGDPHDADELAARLVEVVAGDTADRARERVLRASAYSWEAVSERVDAVLTALR